MLNIKKIKELSDLNHKNWNKVASQYTDPTKNRLLDQTAALKDLKDIKNILDDEKVIFWLIGGTLLGAIRDNDWIKWDEDVDVAVYNEDVISKYDILKKRFMLKGFIFRDAEKPVGTKINLYRYRQKNSIDGLYIDSNPNNKKYRLSRKRKHLRKCFERYGEINFKGMVFRIPFPPEKYLSFMYNNWKKPIKRSRPEIEWRNKKMYRKKEQ